MNERQVNMINPIKIRNVEIAVGAPKIIVPIVEKTADQIVKKGSELKDMKLDVVEWRVDFYEDVMQTERVLTTLSALRDALGEKPLLFTFRTKKEGGEREINLADYTALNLAVAETKQADIIDVEIFSGDDVVKRNIDGIHAAGVLVIGSNHDFFKTPSKADIIYRLRKMQDMGADIPKIAVMPTCKEDVLTLMAATREMSEAYADRPIITMSMGAKGVITRLTGEVFGSSMTFGAVGQVSAPGQIPVEKLTEVLDILHESL